MTWTIEFAAPNIGNANLHANRFGLVAAEAGRLGYEATGSYEAVNALKGDLAPERVYLTRNR
jgi:hypothetical protein